MRLLFGMVLGAALTIGLAYIHDSMYAPLPLSPPPAASEPRPMVNWDVASPSRTVCRPPRARNGRGSPPADRGVARAAGAIERTDFFCA